MGGRGPMGAGGAMAGGGWAGQGGGGGWQGGRAGSLVADGLTLGCPAGVGTLRGGGCCRQGEPLAGWLDPILEGKRPIPPPGIDVGDIHEGVVFLQWLILIQNLHLVLAGHIHLVAKKLGEMHDSHGCWALQESHPCLLLVPIPILQRTLLFLPVPDTFVELDGEADDLVVAQSPLLLLQDLAAVLIGAIGDFSQGVRCVEVPPPFHLIFKKPRDQFIDDVLEGLVRSDAQQRSGFMDLHVTHGAVLVGLQVAHDAGFAEGMQALHDGSSINEVPPAEGTHEVRIQLRDFDPGGPVHDAGVGDRGPGERHPGLGVRWVSGKGGWEGGREGRGGGPQPGRSLRRREGRNLR